MSQQKKVPHKAITLDEISHALNAKLIGNGSLLIHRITEPLEATSNNDLALALQPKFLALMEKSGSRVAVVTEELDIPSGLLDAYLVVSRPRYALAILTQLFSSPPLITQGIHPSAVVEASANIATSASIGALSFIGTDVFIEDGVQIMPNVTIAAGSRIGAGSVLHSGVRIGEDTIIGERVIIHGNACIGADGFSFTTPEVGSVESAQTTKGVAAINNNIVRIHSLGTVVLEDEVEVGACTTIDRATLGQTIVRKGTKIDNLVMVAHNTDLGTDCLIAAQTGISGGCNIGDRVVMGGQVGIADHLNIADDVVLAAATGVARNVPEKALMIDTPALPYAEFISRYKAIGRLKRLFKDVLTLSNRVSRIEKRLLNK